MPQRLTEKTFISMNEGITKQLPLNEATQMVEASDGKKYKSVGAYLVEISRYDTLNKNNRIYPKALWERVIKEQKEIYDGSAGLLDHPKDDPSVSNIFCVWHNIALREDNKTVVAEMHLVGDNGRNAKEFLEAGGKLELSSSGFGDMQFDQQTVEPNSYLIERPADWVFDCSQSVYAKVEDEIKEQVIQKTDLSKKEETTITNIVEKEKKNMDKLTEATLKSCQAYAKAQLQEAMKEENLTKRKGLLSEVISYCEGLPEGFESFIQEATQGITDVESKLAEAEIEVKKLQPLQEKQKLLIDSSIKLEDTNEALKEKCDKAISVLEEAKQSIITLKKERQILKGLYEQAQTEKKDILKDAKVVLKQNETLKEKLTETELKLRKVVISEKREREALADQLASILEERKQSKVREEKKIQEAEKQIERKQMIESYKEKMAERAENTLEAKQKRLLESFGMPASYYTESDKVLNWYKDIIGKNPEAVEYEQQLLSCINLQEAINRYRTLMSGGSKPYSIPNESVTPSRIQESTDDEVRAVAPSALDNCISNTKKLYKSFK